MSQMQKAPTKSCSKIVRASTVPPLQSIASAASFSRTRASFILAPIPKLPPSDPLPPANFSLSDSKPPSYTDALPNITMATNGTISAIVSAYDYFPSGPSDALWLMLCGFLVFFMQCGFALLEAGTVRAKNTKNILLKNMLDACVGAIIWWSFGYMFAVRARPSASPRRAPCPCQLRARATRQKLVSP